MAVRLGLDPLATIESSIVNIATGLSTVDGQPLPIFSLTPRRALENAVQLLGARSRPLHKIVVTIAGFGTFAFGVYYYLYKNKDLHEFFDLLGSRFRGSVTVSADDPLNQDVLKHVLRQGLARDARSLSLLNSSSAAPQFTPDGYPLPSYGRNITIDPRTGQPIVSTKDDDRLLEFVPDATYSYVFWHEGYRITIEREIAVREATTDNGKIKNVTYSPNDPSAAYHLKLTCWSLGAGVGPIIDFLDQVSEINTLARRGDKTTVHRVDSIHAQARRHAMGGHAGQTMWDRGVTRPARTLDSVAMESKIKESLIRDITRYFSPAEERYYAQRGIPWRRGLLFYGPPGTGKTSFSIALAGHFKLRLYIISLTNPAVTDHVLESLFEALPKKCIVLIEDIDTASIPRSDAGPAKPPPPPPEESENEMLKTMKTALAQSGMPMMAPQMSSFRPSGVTLGGLLNVLDGPCSKDGRLVCLTTNSPNDLDAALLRPGRIDSRVLFGYATHEVSALLFKHIFTKTPDEIADDNIEPSHTDLDIPALAEQFAAQMPEKITPAEVQGYLITHRDDPVEAVEEVAKWAEGVVEVKKKGANVKAFDNDIRQHEEVSAVDGIVNGAADGAPNMLTSTRGSRGFRMPTMPPPEFVPQSGYMPPVMMPPGFMSSTGLPPEFDANALLQLQQAYNVNGYGDADYDDGNYEDGDPGMPPAASPPVMVWDDAPKTNGHVEGDDDAQVVV